MKGKNVKRPMSDAEYAAGAGMGCPFCGSGNLEVIDFDCLETFQRLVSRVETERPDLLSRLVIHRTPADGRHLLYRCGEIGGNTKLARRQDGFIEQDGKKSRNILTLIETRGVGGLIVMPGSPLDTHPSGRPYKIIQGSPETDMNAERIWEEAQAGHALGANVAPKIPATIPGFAAMERVVAAQWPVIVTEVFSVDQVIMACELYLRTTRSTGVRSPFFMSPITGILGDHLKKLANRDGLQVSGAMMELAGVGLARQCAAVVAEREYPVTLLFGGSRTEYDLTGLVGAPHHATINWSTFAELIASNPPIDRTIDQPLDPDVERTLLSTFPDVWKGWQEGRLSAEDFEEFGPVQHFRDVFLAGWQSVLEMVADRRAERVRV